MGNKLNDFKSASISTRRVRFVCWTLLAAGIATAATSPWSGIDFSSLGGAHQGPSGRKTTDPPVAARGKFGQDLFLAIDHRNLAEVQSLIKNGADPDARNGLEFTPLAIAAASHQTDVMEVLLKAGAKPDADSAYGTALTFAAATGNVSGFHLLLAHGADVNTARGDGTTVLMMAANTGVPPIVEELLKRKADLEATDTNGTTALGLAARGGHDAITQMLLKAGAAVDPADRDLQTPLMAAAKNGHDKVVRMLLKSGANPNARDSKGRTALVLAASYGDYPDVARALLDGGADAKSADSVGRSAATLASLRGYMKTAAILGAKPGVASKLRTPKQAIPLSLKALQSSMKQFSDMTACISCHQEGLGRITTGVARARGFQLDPQVVQAQRARIDGALNAMKPLHEMALKDPEVMKQVPLIEINEVTTIDSWLLAGMAAQGDPANEATAAMARVLARQQLPDGHWAFSLPRVPMQSSFVTFTALAVKSLRTYMPKSSAAETSDRIRRAKAWLLQAPAKSSEDRASRLLGLKWAGANARELQDAITAVRKDQHPDGGWSQLPGTPSDAYATGQALYALHEAGSLPVRDPIYVRGVEFLLRTQDDDGSWFVNKRALPANNYFDAGFPHGQSQYASFNGTCWATLALLETIAQK